MPLMREGDIWVFCIFARWFCKCCRKLGGCRPTVVDQVIMKMQEKQGRKVNGIREAKPRRLSSFARLTKSTTRWNDIHHVVSFLVQEIDAKFFEYGVRDYIRKCSPWFESSTFIFKNALENFCVNLHGQMRDIFKEVLTITWKYDKRMKVKLQISKCFCSWANVVSSTLT